MVGTIVPASRVEFTILGTGYMARAHEAMGHVRPTGRKLFTTAKPESIEVNFMDLCGL